MYNLFKPTNLLYRFSTRYKVPFNINKEENKQYLRQVRKTQNLLNQSQQIQSILPRRKRRIYDKPRIDTDLTQYDAWRICDPQEMTHKPSEHIFKVNKIMLQPKWLVHAFGVGNIPVSQCFKSTHREYTFEDNNLSKYILYEYRCTTAYKQNIPNYDYQNQQHLYPKQRIIKRSTPQQFWKSQQHFEFRLNSSQYAQHYKFKRWIQQQIQKRKTLKSYDEYIDQKYGKVYTYNKKQQSQLFVKKKPFVFNVKPEDFLIKQSDNKTDKKKSSQPLIQKKIEPKKKLDEIYRINKGQNNQARQKKQSGK